MIYNLFQIFSRKMLKTLKTSKGGQIYMKDPVLLQNFFANSMIQLVKEPTHTEGIIIVMTTIVFQKLLKNLVSH